MVGKVDILSAGSVTVNVEPLPNLDSTDMVPPFNLTISLTKWRPTPLQSDFVVKNLLQTLGISPSLIQTPLSTTLKTAALLTPSYLLVILIS